MATDKKIGLITFISNNYGTLLQAYAIKKAIEEISGGTVTFYSYERSVPNSEVVPLRKKICGIFRHSIRELLNWRKYKQIIAIRNLRFDLFKKKIYSNDETFKTIGELKSVGDSFDSGDIVVCGSDMIWSAEYEKYFDVYMLSWCGKARRVAYAPSIGNTGVDISLQKKYSELLKDFVFLSCREFTGADFIGKILNRDIPVVLDPTLLFDGNRWLQWFPVKHKKAKPYILIYCFGGITPETRNQVQNLADRNGLEIRYLLPSSLMDTVCELRFGDGAYGPEEYVDLFSDAAFTVVNGYHGLLFSLLFEKPFVLLHRDRNEHWSTHENRMSEMLSMLHLEDRYVEPTGTLSAQWLQLDYRSVREIINEQRDKSWSYLRRALL